ncbi:glycoside hydrolase domain-containing protein [Corynebacterium sp. AOP34-AQ2-28]|uniref:glycoside hydrolase domain-containing protein n=1 Tax=Corynebacterium sp. AOP34-AQ2-28 TaxID=3457689 RepID=UPI0040342840
MSTVIDFSAAFPSGRAIKAAGHDGVVAYISPARENWMQAKPLTKAHVDEYRAAGLKIAVVWQYGAGTAQASDVMRGAAGGRADAEAAQKRLNAVGLAGHPVFFAVDFDITLNQWNSVAVEYFKAAGAVLGKHRVGIYGHSRVVHWAMEDDVVATVAPGRVLGWVTRSWSNGATGSDYAVLYQRQHNVPGPDGVQTDINDVYHASWGHQPITDTTPETPQLPSVTKQPGWSGDPSWIVDALKAWGVKTVEEDGWRNRGNGDFLTLWGVFAHHTGADNTPTWLIRDGRADLKGMLSQIHLLRDGTAHITGQGVAWHAGRGAYPGLPTNNANYHTIGIEANSSGTSPWPAAQLDAYYRACAAICWVLDVPASRVIGHKEYSSDGKWDPGGIDMPAFRARVQHYIDNPPFLAEENIMSDFDKITRTYPSRVEGSTVKLKPVDALYMADANSFVARANTVEIIAALRDNTEALDRVETKLDTLISGGK